MKYKVNYSGFTYIEADSKEEALELYQGEDKLAYSEQEVVSVEEVDDFVIEM